MPAADVRAAKAAVDQAEASLANRERQRLGELGAEIEARIAAVDRAESAEETAAEAAERAEEARAAQVLTISMKRGNSVKFTGEQRIFTGEVAYFTGEERRLSAVCRDAA